MAAALPGGIPLVVTTTNERLQVVWEIMPPDATGAATLAFMLLPKEGRSVYSADTYANDIALEFWAVPAGRCTVKQREQFRRALPSSPFPASLLPPQELQMAQSFELRALTDGRAVHAPSVQLVDGNGFSRDAKVFSGTSLPVPSVWHNASLRVSCTKPGFVTAQHCFVNLPKMAQAMR